VVDHDGESGMLAAVFLTAVRVSSSNLRSMHHFSLTPRHTVGLMLRRV